MTCHSCDGHRCRACINPLQRQRSNTYRFFWFCCWAGVIGIPLTYLIRWIQG
jgi:hypothetical protein